MWIEITWTKAKASNGILEHIGSVNGAMVCQIYKLGRFVVLDRIDGARLAGHCRTIAEAKSFAHKLANTDHPFATLAELDAIRAALPVELTDEEIEAAEAAKVQDEFNACQGTLF